MSLNLTTPPPTPTPDPPSTTPPAPVATGAPADARLDARMAALRPATLAAVCRDLDRLTRVLADPITAVRRAALAAQVGYLVSRLRSADPEFVDRHGVTLARLQHEARCWSREPGQRPALRAATERAATALAPTIAAGPADLLVTAGGAANRISVLDLPTHRPTALAYRYFWLLDDLPHAPELLTREFTAPVRWVLRNVLSGGYNRRAHLMWVGGGSGAAV